MEYKSKLYNISGNLISDASIKINKRNRLYAVARVKGAHKTTTVVSHAKKAIAALAGKKAGEFVCLFGVYDEWDNRLTFNAMGSRGLKPAAPTP